MRVMLLFEVEQFDGHKISVSGWARRLPATCKRVHKPVTGQSRVSPALFSRGGYHHSFSPTNGEALPHRLRSPYWER